MNITILMLSVSVLGIQNITCGTTDFFEPDGRSDLRAPSYLFQRVEYGCFMKMPEIQMD